MRRPASSSGPAARRRARPARPRAAARRRSRPGRAIRSGRARASCRRAPPVRRRRARSGAGTASRTRSRARPGGRTRSSPGLPRARRRRRARGPRAARGPAATAVSTSAPTPVDVDRLERRAIEDAALEVGRHEARLDVVAREAERGLRQVVGAEGEERGLGRQPVGDEARPRQLDHRADDVVLPSRRPCRSPMRTTSARISASSASKSTSGIMISSCGGVDSCPRREHDRLDLHLVDLRVHEALDIACRSGDRTHGAILGAARRARMRRSTRSLRGDLLIRATAQPR